MEREKFKDFHDALAHGNVGGYGTYVFFDCTRKTARIVVEYKLNGQQKEPFDVENITEEQHVEEVALKTLTEKIRQEHESTGQKVKAEVKIYINFSPCHNCSEKLLQFMSLPEADNVRMTIIIAALYDIVRKSCIESCITGHRLCRRHVQYFFDQRNPLDSVNNKLGLRNLNRAEGITLRSFDTRDWLFVLNYLFRFAAADDNSDSDEGDDVGEAGASVNAMAGLPRDATYRDLQLRMGEVNIGANLKVQQREQEDQRQRKDLNDIFEEEEVAAAIGQQAFRYPTIVHNQQINLTWGKMGYNAAGLPAAMPELLALPAPNIIDTSYAHPDGVHHPRLKVNAVSQADAGEYFCVAQHQDGTRVSSYTVKLTVDG